MKIIDNVSEAYLTKTFLTSPYGRVDDFQEELTGSRIKYKDRAVNRFCSQITFESLVNCDTIYVGIINKPTQTKNVV